MLEATIIQLPHMKKGPRERFIRSLRKGRPRLEFTPPEYEVEEEDPEKFEQWAASRGIYVVRKDQSSPH